MKQFRFWVSAYLFSIVGFFAEAQQVSTCLNADFELGNFTNWSGSTGSCCPISATFPGLVPGRHTIMTGPGTDPFSNGNVPVVAPGGVFSARLGNSNIGSEAEKLSYSFSVGSNNTLFIYRYAVIFEDPNHDAASQPRFEIRVFDQAGNPINCGTYNVYSSGGIPGFVTYNDPLGNTYHYKNWTTVGIDLSSYIGQNVTIEFSAGDCAYGGHFGYAYLDTYCSPLVISSDFCPGSFSTTINAPEGFVSYLWNTGETTPSIQVNNPVVGSTYTCVMTSVAGCTVSLSTILQETIIASGIAQSSLCQNAVEFTDSSQVIVGSPINQWLWNFGDGNSSTSQNPTHNYTNPGTYTVTLIATNTGGCSDTTTQQVQVIPPPVVDFSINPACPGSASQLLDQSSSSNGNIVSWVWDFGDASAGSTQQNPFHTYNLPGTYNVSLIATDGAGCTDTLTLPTQPLPGPIAGFTAISNCQDNLINFTDTSLTNGSPVVSWEWNFGDNSQVVNGTGSPSHNYSNPGTYNVTMVATTANGCTDTISQTISVFSSLLPDFIPDTACAGNIASLQSSSSVTNGVIQSYLWNFNDGTPVSSGLNVNHVFQSAGVYNVTHTIVANNGCRDSIQKQVVVLAGPQAVIGSTEVCPGSITVFNSPSIQGASPILTYGWNFGDGSQDTLGFSIFHTYYTSGTYLVTHFVVDQNGCADTVTQNINTSPIPVANFVTPLVCAGLPSTFNNASGVTVGTITDYQWYFGDLSPTSNDTNPVHTYMVPGAYFVSLVVTSDNGCRDTVIEEVVVASQPLAIATANNTCVSDPVVISAQNSVAVNGSITSYQWNYGNGYFTGNVTTNATFTSAGAYPIDLIVTNSTGCSDTTTVLINTFDDPVTNFVADTVCIGSPTTFNNASLVATGGPLSFAWAFGDGDTSYAFQPSHIYAAPGNYTVTLTAQSNAGCSTNYTENIVVWDLPNPQIAIVPPGCVPYQITLTDLSTSTNSSIVAWDWGLGFGQTSTLQNPTANFPSSGIYPVNLQVTDANGCVADSFFQAWITVNPVPIAQFTVDSVCFGDTTILQDASISTGGVINSWNWQASNGGIWQSGTNNYPIAYPATGSYTASLIVTDVNGCKDTTTNTAWVEPTPNASFTVSTTCEGSPTQFLNNSTIVPTIPLTYFWQFGVQGATSIQQQPTYLFPNSGIFSVTLTASSPFGCVDSITLPALVVEPPTPLINPVAAGCSPYEVFFTDASTYTSSPIASWFWDFGNGDTSSLQNPITTYPLPGSYSVSLTLVDQNGCSADSIFQALVEVNPTPEANFYFDPTSPSVFLSSLYFHNTSTNADSYVWDFGDGNFSTEENPFHVYDSTGSYIIQLVAQNIFGCIDTLLQSMQVANDYALWTPNAFTPNGDGVNELFLPRGFNVFNYNLSIFNRWGQMVFYSNNLEEGWNGTINGKEANQDVYVFTMRFKDIFKKEHYIVGKVSLIR